MKTRPMFVFALLVTLLFAITESLFRKDHRTIEGNSSEYAASAERLSKFSAHEAAPMMHEFRPLPPAMVRWTIGTVITAVLIVLATAGVLELRCRQSSGCDERPAP